MGTYHSRETRHFLDSIEQKDEQVMRDMLQANPDLAKQALFDGKTNPICRAACCGFL